MAPLKEREGTAGVDLAFRNVTYSVQIPGKKSSRFGPRKDSKVKTILNDLSGVCKAGELLAIMGPSGAGKTSLLDILAGQKAQSSGSFCLGGRTTENGEDMRRISSYVQQDDAIMASQTVREAVTMAALLTLPKSMTKQEKLDRANKIMTQFSLDGCGDTMVGDPVAKIKGVSGGEKKRTAVAMAAVRNPQIFFLDEPTSGLDSFKAYVLVKVLKELAASTNATVVCTIHQPSSDIFALFDGLMLLLGGNTVYYGKCMEAVTHFAAVGYPCPTYANPPDFFFMHVLASPDGNVAEGDRMDVLVKAWADSALQKVVDQDVNKGFSGTASSALADSEKRIGNTASPWLQFSCLMFRGFMDAKRNKMRFKAQVMQAIIFALIILLIWMQVGNDMNGVQNRAGAMFFMTANGMMQNVLGVLTTFANERGAVLRETENGMYSTLPYFFARILVDLPIKTICPIIFGTLAYWGVGLRHEGGKFLLYLVVLVLLAYASNAVGLFLACIFPDVQIGLVVAPMVVLPLMMFSGFFLNPESTPKWLIWVQWISPMKYSFSAIVQNEFNGLSLHCTDTQYRQIIVHTPAGEQIIKVCPYTTGDQYVDQLNIQAFLTIPMCMVLLAVMAVGFTLLAYLGLVLVSRRSRAKAKKAGVVANKKVGK